MGRILFVLIGTTVFEVAGLVTWMEFDARARTGGLLILFAGLVLERLVVTGIPKSDAKSSAADTWLTILGSAWWEYAAWALWLKLIQAGAGPIGVLILVLFAGLHGQHCFNASFRVSRTFGQLVRHPGIILFSLIEAGGGAIWLALFSGSAVSNTVAHLVIGLAILIEHIVQGLVMNTINQQGRMSQMGQLA
jgi:hypothetical protein